MPNHGTLVNEAYADSSKLAKRISIYEYQLPRLDLVGLALEHLGEVAGPVLDVGWGTGTLTRRLRAERPGVRVVPLDLSHGMRPEVVGEVDRLPFATGSAGAALAMHMLYYATDQRAALAELHRVLRPGGQLVLSTNGHESKREFTALWTFALRDLGYADPPRYPRTDATFLLDQACRLVEDVFGAARLVEHRSEIVVPVAGPVLGFIDSMSAEQARHLPAGVTWTAYLAAAERRVEDEIERTGAFRLTGHAGLVAATR